MNYFYLGLINSRFVILFIFLSLKIAMGVTLHFLDNKKLIITKWYYLFICLTIFYIVIFIFNFLFFIGRYHLHCILDCYEEHVFKSGKIFYSDYIILLLGEFFFLFLILLLLFMP